MFSSRLLCASLVFFNVFGVYGSPAQLKARAATLKAAAVSRYFGAALGAGHLLSNASDPKFALFAQQQFSVTTPENEINHLILYTIAHLALSKKWNIMAFGDPKRIEIKYDAATVENMLTLLEASPFPNRAPIDAKEQWKLGMDYDYLKALKTKFLTEWSWESLEKKIAKLENYMVHYEHEGDALDLHFIHMKSQRSDAIPLILLHGWPGTFMDFHKVIEPLINPSSSSLPAFHVVVPSLPGYFLSTLPRRDGWSLSNNARLFNKLMTSALGYSKYAGQGGDWGSSILRIMGSLFPESLSIIHLNMFIAPPAPGSDPSTYSEVEKRLVSSRDELSSIGFGYNLIQKTKPFTIGIAVASSPLAVLTYIGEKMYSWSDPERVDMQNILNTVALYYLSGTFATSVVIYNQAHESDKLSLGASENPWLLKNRFGYSAFPFEAGGAPKRDIAAYGPLVYYKEHSNGGHFPALDSPTELVEDLREFSGENWNKA